MRTLRQGARGEDVLLWQQFLELFRQRPDAGFVPRLTRLDGIFGAETAKATQAFQRQVELPPDAVVGPATYKKARSLGFLDRQVMVLSPGVDAIAPVLGPLMSQIADEGEGIADVERDSEGTPQTAAGTSAEASFKRLRGEAWQRSGDVQNGLREGRATFQLLKDGSGDYIYDEYSVGVDTMPQNMTPEAFLQQMATDLNGTVKDAEFNIINVFKRRKKGSLTVGEVIDIDIMGPDNGSVVVVEVASSYFIFQTVQSESNGSHPENGAREFGFERAGHGCRFYTRGVSRPGNYIIRLAGAIPQQRGWTSLMQGISAAIRKLGGRSNPASFRMSKESRSQ